jgi:hypothetical protein
MRALTSMAHISFRFPLIVLVCWVIAYTLKRKTEVSLLAVRESDLDVNADKFEYTFMARKQMEENITT